MKFKINTIIVDDKPMFAESICEVLEKRNEQSEIAEYIPKVFSRRTHYNDAKQYILDCVKKKISVDLFFSDYHLEAEVHENGIELFRLFEGTPIRPFRILHSNTTLRFTEHSEEFISGLYDQFSSSKSEEMIMKRLNEYEEQIIKTKMYGNPNFTEVYYPRSWPGNRKEPRYKSYNLRDLLFVSTNNNLQTIVYRHTGEDGTIILKKDTPTGPEFRTNHFVEETNNLKYLKLNQSTLVNLLWVSKIDQIEKKVYFIVPDSKKLVLPLNQNISPLFAGKNFNFVHITKSLHRYFL